MADSSGPKGREEVIASRLGSGKVRDERAGISVMFLGWGALLLIIPLRCLL